MVVKRHDFGFWCKFCKSVYYVKEFKYRETEDFHEYEVICPGCGNTLVLKQRTAMSYIRMKKW